MSTPRTKSRKAKIDLTNKRMVAYIPDTGYVKDRGYRVSFVVEGEAFHRPTGGGDVVPWYWGHDYKKAQQIAREYNQKIGISLNDELKIVADSMARGLSTDRFEEGQ